MDTISIRENKAVVTGSESLNRGHCLAACPAGAVSVSALNPGLSDFRHFKPGESRLPYKNEPHRPKKMVEKGTEASRETRN